MWLTDNSFMEVVKKSWAKPSGDLVSKFSSLAADLREWSQFSFGNLYRRKRRVMARLRGSNGGGERLLLKIE